MNPKSKSFSKQIVFLALLTIMGTEVGARADAELQTTTSETPTGWQLIRKKLRAGNWTEYMAPGITGNGDAIPMPDGSSNVNNAYNITWIDYEIAPDWKLLYWQRTWVFMTPNSSQTTPGNLPFTPILRNPRFALRRTNVFGNVSNLSTTYDVYIQPGLAPEAEAAGRKFEIGFRTSTSYTLSRLSLGLITEFTTSFFGPASTGANYYGWGNLWFSYEFNKTFSTMHNFAANFKHQPTDLWSSVSLDTLFPYVQNGINVAISPNVTATVLVNNYLFEPVSLSNTWASLWLSLSIL